ncbi:MAG: amidohydrolase, partial [Peptococcaceae bacterium]|nr:amidohydrolase [Peptococcaceae bacterium]
MEQAVETMKRDVRDHARRSREEIWQIARQIGEHPELGYQEYFAVEVLSDYLRRNGFSVETGIAGLETAFVARYPRSAPLISAAETGAGTKIAFLAEYDALPEIGHGCGHHLIAAASAGAAAVLSKIASLPGEVWVVGTPAEETSGAKVLLAEQGFFA